MENSLYCTFMIYGAAAKSRQSCPALCDPTDTSPPGSSVPGIFQARILEWVAISFSIYISDFHQTSLVAQMVKASVYKAGDPGLIPGSGRSSGEGNGNPTALFLPGKSHGLRSLAGYSPRGCKESDTTEQLHNNNNIYQKLLFIVKLQ